MGYETFSFDDHDLRLYFSILELGVNAKDVAVVYLNAFAKRLNPGPESMALVSFGCETRVCCVEFHCKQVLNKLISRSCRVGSTTESSDPS